MHFVVSYMSSVNTCCTSAPHQRAEGVMIDYMKDMTMLISLFKSFNGTGLQWYFSVKGVGSKKGARKDIRIYSSLQELSPSICFPGLERDKKWAEKLIVS